MNVGKKEVKTKSNCKWKNIKSSEQRSIINNDFIYYRDDDIVTIYQVIPLMKILHSQASNILECYFFIFIAIIIYLTCLEFKRIHPQLQITHGRDFFMDFIWNIAF